MQNEALCRSAALDTAMWRPQSPPYLRSIWVLPASLPRGAQRTRSAKRHSEPSSTVQRALLFGCQLGRRERLETLVRDRLTALDREPVGPGRETLLGPVHGGE